MISKSEATTDPVLLESSICGARNIYIYQGDKYREVWWLPQPPADRNISPLMIAHLSNNLIFLN